MTWLWENPIPILVIGVVVTVSLLIGLYQTNRTGFLYAIGAAILTTAGLWFASKTIITDREAVLQTIEDGATAVRANDWNKALTYIAPANQETAKRLLRDIKGVNIVELTVFSRDVVFPPGDRPMSCDAAVILRLSVSGRYQYAGGMKVNLHLVREGERWVVESYEVGQ